MQTQYTPDDWARSATAHRQTRGIDSDEIGFKHSVNSIKARADWVLVNGKWVPRKGIMRHG